MVPKQTPARDDQDAAQEELLALGYMMVRGRAQAADLFQPHLGGALGEQRLGCSAGRRCSTPDLHLREGLRAKSGPPTGCGKSFPVAKSDPGKPPAEAGQKLEAMFPGRLKRGRGSRRGIPASYAKNSSCEGLRRLQPKLILVLSLVGSAGRACASARRRLGRIVAQRRAQDCGPQLRAHRPVGREHFHHRSKNTTWRSII
jgi:hypothetical protein